ncbi:MAG: alpha/beta hydrolase [Flavobacteriaceae bacterium]|nr:alpha/beta hydrolase [Flavobacteriaceae bacterium]
MSYTTDTFITNDGEEIFYYRWKKVNPKAIVQIAHGVGEHAGRYQAIASSLQSQGFEVYANDHRIHGNSVKSKELLGFYEGENYFDDAVEDMRELTKIIRQEHSSRKLILFGHSMGSLLSREYVTRYGKDIHALALSGTASFMRGLGTIGLAGANMVKLFKGRQRSSSMLKSLFFTEFNKKFKPNRTKVDWISRDEKQVDLFETDPLRIEDFSTSVFIDILKASRKINQPPTFEATPKNLPIYIFSGDQDPVGEMGKGIQKVANQYIKAGLSDLTLKIYEGGRHEMLNEINKEEVERDFINWLNQRIDAKN